MGESFVAAWNGNIFRYLLGLHLVWCINSVCHIWGHRPFDKNITPTDSYFMGFIGFGEFRGCPIKLVLTKFSFLQVKVGTIIM
jgi:fatty-acid desaturase